MRNLYTLPPFENDAELDAALQKAMTTRTSAYDSHPAPCDRVVYIERVVSPGFDQHDPRPVWDLFPVSTSLQEEMTELVVSNLHAIGITWQVGAKSL